LLFEPGDEVIIPSIHFIGADNAIRACGATPVYCDVDRHTLNPTLEHIKAVCNADKTQAVILLHYGGVAQELDAIRQWCDEEVVWLIEDAACAQATTYKGYAAGTWGHFGVWSFDAMKVMTCGDGGMIHCGSRAYANQLRRLLYLGTDNTSGLSSDGDRWWEFSVVEPGRRAIMNDVAAGIGLEQLKRLPEFVKRRQEIALAYTIALGDLVDQPSHSYPYYFYWIQTPQRDALARHLREHGIYTTFRYYPLHRVFKTGQTLLGADYAADHTLLLPLHQGLSDDDVSYVIDKVKEFYR
jgi:aminotransferase